MDCGETVFSKGVLGPAGAGVVTRSADSLLDLSVVVVVGWGGVLQFLVKANAWLLNKIYLFYWLIQFYIWKLYRQIYENYIHK